MQIKYTFIRPNFQIPFINPAVPGLNEYFAALFAAGFEHHETMSPDMLTTTLTYTLTDEQFVDYEILLEDFKPVVDANRQYRLQVGITGSTEIIP